MHIEFKHVFNSLNNCLAEYLKPIAEEERKVEEAEKKAREEQERIYKQLSEGNNIPCIFYII